MSEKLQWLTVSAIALSCKGLVKRYDDLVAVAGLNLEVQAGECFGLLGPNGAGKTTTVEILEGLLSPDEGQVTVLGKSWRGDGRELRQLLGIQLQDTQLNEKLTVLETITLFRSFYRNGSSPGSVLARVGLQEKADAWVRKLSGGQRQRLSLACALVAEPDLLFLDEPTTGLDPQSRRNTWDIVSEFRAAGGTVLLTTHYMEEAQHLCDRVAVIDHGKRIALGSPRELIASLGAEHVIEVETERPVDAAPLTRLPGVRTATCEAGILRLTVSAPHEAIPALLGELERQAAVLTRLTTHHATLEDVFVSLTGRHLRDN